MSDGVLVMAFGGPASMDEVGPFCARLMGREPSPEVLERVSRRYLTIGGSSPLPSIARSIAQGLEEKLAADGARVPVETGMRYSRPTMGEGIAALVRRGGDRIVTVSLSPFESSHSSGAYRDAVVRAAVEYPRVTIAEAPSFRTTEAFLTAVTTAVHDSLAEVAGKRTGVLFTAHSLPVDEIGGDPYVEQLRQTTNGVAAQLGLALPIGDCRQRWLPGVDAYGTPDTDVPWLFAYQSKGQRPGEWLGPDVDDVVREMAKAGFEAVVFVPVGFATDHMETLYDLDVQACGLAYDLGMDYARAAVPNDSDEMVEALAKVVEPLLG
jgi:ferrochelatase